MKDVVLTFVFGVCTPSFDIYSDLALIIELLPNHPDLSFALACPMIASTVFILPHWWQLEQTMHKKIYTFPLVILQFYYQYKMIQVLYLGIYKKDKQWKQQKDTLLKDVSSIGKIYFKVNINYGSMNLNFLPNYQTDLQVEDIIALFREMYNITSV